MAKKRMFAEEVVRSDIFLDLPQSSQLLYFHFGMIADDDGIVASVDRELRYLGFGSKDDLRLLIEKKLIDITNDGKLIFIIDWLKNNNLRSDRYYKTIHTEARKELEAKGYHFKNKNFGARLGIPKVNQSAATDIDIDIDIDKGIDKDKDIEIDKNSLLSAYFNTFTKLASKNNKLRDAVKVEFLKLPDFQKEQAVIGAKNYAKWYKTENPDDSIGKFTTNAINFIIGDKETFDDFQEEIKVKKKTLGGFI
ncbi:phage replisome organizer protein [Lactococcus lactis]|uniref:phage replisome organizer protein n=1 Tax=Lactococcus lactis TaxID=1358 RepID=UPI0038D0EDF1